MNELEKYSDLNQTFNDLRKYIVRFDQNSMELHIPVGVHPNIDIQGALKTYCQCIEQAPSCGGLGSLLGQRQHVVESAYYTWIFHWNSMTRMYLHQKFGGNPSSANWWNNEDAFRKPDDTEDTDYTEVNNLLT